MTPLLIAFFDGDETDPGVRVSSDGESVRLTVGGETVTLSRQAAADLQRAVGDALTERQEFLHTAGEYREDGTYVVSRRCAESTGNRKVFDSFDNLRRLYERLPAEFTAEDVGCTGITGSRRHMLVRHVGEHPTFDCEVTQRNPLTVRKTSPESVPEQDGDGEVDAESATAD